MQPLVQYKRMMLMCMTALLVFTGFASVFTPLSADAAIKTVTDNDKTLTEPNRLVLYKDPTFGGKTGFSVSHNIPKSRLTDLSGEKKYHSIPDKYRTFNYRIKNPQPSDRFVVRHENVGTYDGRSIDLTATYYDFVYDLNINSTGGTKSEYEPGYAYLEIVENVVLGFIYYNMSNLKVDYEYTDSVTGATIDFSDGGSYVTVPYLWGYDDPELRKKLGATTDTSEYVQYDNADTWRPTDKLNAYLTDTTVLKSMGHKSQNNGRPYYGGDNYDFSKFIGHPTFTNNAVMFELTGDVQHFTYGSSNRNSAWQYGLNSAVLFHNTAPAPTMRTISMGNCEINDGDIVAGEPFVYELEQKTQVAYEDIMERYNRMEFIINWPEGVRFDTWEFVDENGKAVDPKYYNQSVNMTTRQLKVTLKPEFYEYYKDPPNEQRGLVEVEVRDGALTYQGESYMLRMKGVVDSIHAPSLTADGKMTADGSVKMSASDKKATTTNRVVSGD